MYPVRRFWKFRRLPMDETPSDFRLSEKSYVQGCGEGSGTMRFSKNRIDLDEETK
jgi:hypothetical protein